MTSVASQETRGNPSAPPTVLPFPTTPAGLPPELTERPHWVGWRWAFRDGKWTKPPVDPHTGRAGDCRERSTWGTFAQAVAFAQRTGLPGIGVQLTADMWIVGVDLDKCRDPETGEVEDWAMLIVYELDTYTQVSPTGTGLRLFLKAKIPGERRRTGKIEMYSEGRYLTLTAARLPVTPDGIEERQAELAEWYAKVFPPTPPPPARSAEPLGDDDESVLRRCRENRKTGSHFERLWNGDLSDHGGDESAGDLALCNYLRFFSGDRAQVERLWGRSALGRRAKWERANYRTWTLDKAMDGEVYTPPPLIDLHRNVSDRRAGGAVALAAVPVPVEDEEDDAIAAGGGYARSDTGNAERLLAAYGDRLRYCDVWRRWLVWDGRRWKEDPAGCRVERYARRVVRGMFKEATALAPADAKASEALFKHALASQAAGRLVAMVQVARTYSQVWITSDDLDADPWLLNCRNGIIDLRSGRLLPHDPARLLTRMAPVEYDPAAPAPAWERFVAGVTETAQGQPDPALAAYLQRAIGHSLTGDQAEQAVYFPYGKGANGKSTLLNTIKFALGEYAMQAKDDLLMVKRHEAHPTELADLYRKRLVVSTELEDGRRLAEALVKQMTGGERIRARRMREDFWEFDPTHTVWVAANHRPEIRGTDHAIWRRIRLLPFDCTYYDRQEDAPEGLKHRVKDTDLMDRLRGELPGILAWAVRGCVAWKREGLVVPERVREATATYRADMDVLAAFLEERCEIVSQASCLATPLYRAYVAWCEANGEKPESQTRFGGRLEERGHAKARGGAGGQTVRLGLRLRPTDPALELPE
jgi:putative DNA primase/helicase